MKILEEIRERAKNKDLTIVLQKTILREEQ